MKRYITKRDRSEYSLVLKDCCNLESLPHGNYIVIVGDSMLDSNVYIWFVQLYCCEVLKLLCNFLYKTNCQFHYQIRKINA